MRSPLVLMQEDHFACFICLQTIRSSSILPCCGKLACEQCLKDWFASTGRGKTHCPHCRRQLGPKDIVSCPAFDTLKEHFQGLAVSKADAPVCKKHGDVLKYYCLDCDQACCADGLVIHNDHTGHKVELVKGLKDRFSQASVQVTQSLVTVDKMTGLSIHQVLEAKKKKYVKQINGFVELLEASMTAEIRAAEPGFLEACREHRKGLKDLREDFNEMKQYYTHLVDDGKYMVKAGSWLGGIEEKVGEIQEALGRAHERVNITNWIETPQWSFSMAPSDAGERMIVLKQVFIIASCEKAVKVEYLDAKVNFEMQLETEGIVKCVKLGPSSPSQFVLLDHFKLGEAVLLNVLVWPLTYKDAYEAITA